MHLLTALSLLLQATGQRQFTTIEVPWLATMTPGGGYDVLENVPISYKFVNPSTAFTSTEAEAGAQFFTSFDSSEEQTKRSFSASVDVKAKMLVARVKAGFGIESLSESSRKSAELAVTFYEESPIFLYSLRPDDASSLSTTIKDYDKLKMEFADDAKTNKLASFYRKHGTHLIIGWQKAYTVRVRATANSSVDSQSQRLHAYLSGSYNALSVDSQMDAAQQALSSKRSFTFSYERSGQYGSLPTVATSYEQLISPSYIQSLYDVLTKAKDQDSTSAAKDDQALDTFERGNRVLAICAPWSEVLQEDETGDLAIRPLQTLEQQLVDDWQSKDRIITAYTGLRNVNANTVFLSDEDLKTLNDAVTMADEQNGKIEGWLELLMKSKPEEYSANRRKVRTELIALAAIKLVDIPELTILRHGRAWSDSVYLVATLRVPKGPFQIRVYSEEDQKNLLGPIDVFSSNPMGPPFYVDSPSGIHDTPSYRDIVLYLRAHGIGYGQRWPDNSPPRMTKYRVELVTTKGQNVISSVQVLFVGPEDQPN